MSERKLTTRRGIEVRVLELGSGPPLVWLHGVLGLMTAEPLLDQLAHHYRVYAPEWPGYGESGGEALLEDMLDFSLHGWDVIDALDLPKRPVLLGHCMGGMIAAEMACLCPERLQRLILAAASGLWIPETPVPDLFATLPFDLPQLLFHDAKLGERLLAGGIDFGDMESLQRFLIANHRRLGTAGKILFPIPNRRVAKRLYRLTTDALVLWGREDRLMPPVYAERWHELLPNSEVVLIERAGHMLPYEQTSAAAEAIHKFLA